MGCGSWGSVSQVTGEESVGWLAERVGVPRSFHPSVKRHAIGVAYSLLFHDLRRMACVVCV
jgi:hypothetical protein